MQYSVVNYSHHAVHYTPRTYLSYNWKFVPFEHLQSFPPPHAFGRHQYFQYVNIFYSLNHRKKGLLKNENIKKISLAILPLGLRITFNNKPFITELFIFKKCMFNLPLNYTDFNNVEIWNIVISCR